MKRKTRFAILCRVSTEAQEKGESLERHEKSLREHVKRLGGTIPKGCVYKGQEHSSVGFERVMLEKLLADAKSKKYDALMIDDVSRLGRDALTSILALTLTAADPPLLTKNDPPRYFP
jgi:DNA invertase Pin-like site-specific DNA recombinase